MEKVTALPTEKDDLEHRVISKQNLQYVFGHQKFHARTKIQSFSNESSSKTAELSGWQVDGRNKTGSYAEHRVWRLS